MTRGARPARRWAPPLALVVGLVVLWEVYVRLAAIDPVDLPAPTRVLGALWDFRETAGRPSDPDARRDARRRGASRSSWRSRAAVALDRWEPIRRAVEPLLVASQTIPVVAIAPLFVIWFGFGLLPKVLIVVLVTFFPVTIALLDGFGRVRPRRRT